MGYWKCTFIGKLMKNENGVLFSNIVIHKVEKYLALLTKNKKFNISVWNTSLLHIIIMTHQLKFSCSSNQL